MLFRSKEKAKLVNIPKLNLDLVNAGGNISERDGYYNEDKYPERVTPEEAKISLGIVLKEIESAKIEKEILL